MAEALFATDIESTLTHAGVLASKTKEGLFGLYENDVVVAYVTGVRLASYHRKFGLGTLNALPLFDELALENGCILYNITETGQLVEDLEWRSMVLGINGQAYKYFQDWVASLPAELRNPIEWKQVMASIPVAKVPEGGVETLLAKMDGTARMTINQGTVELIPSAAGKDHVTAYIAEKRRSLITIGAGDGNNDTHLQIVQHPLSFANAHPFAVNAVKSGRGYLTTLEGHAGSADLLSNAFSIAAGGTYS